MKGKGKMKEKLALEYLEVFNGGGIRLGLENITLLMERLGNPEDKLQIIHIGGTNGKGSTSAFISNALKENGYKVGCFNSPYLVTPRENIRINNENINEEDFLACVIKVTESAKVLKAEGHEPSYFEIMVGVAFTYFYEKQVDFVVLEVGLGGALDGTNVIKKSLISVITKISIDHKDFLGDTLTSIATQKAGIIKENGLVVTGTQDIEVMTVLQKVCEQQNAKLIEANCKAAKVVSITQDGTCFEIAGESYHLGLIGAHQVYNCMIALEVLNVLKEKGVQLGKTQIRRALNETKWEGRFEKIGEKPLFFIDGAHNVDGIMALRDTITALEKRYTIGIVGILKDKEVDEMLEIIAPCFETLIVTTPHNPRAMNAETLANKIKSYGKEVYETGNIHEAKEKALEIAALHENSQIIGFGSLYMIGELRG
mgnify:CR=1 FL=1